MTRADRERLRVLLGQYGPVWHAGRHTGKTLYQGEADNDDIGRMDTPQAAELVVLLHEYAREQLLKDGG